ncbi:MAG: LodA/GoxA family CTQ-dependent oxidase [Nitrospinae bacterium]|nr:LodA/GoxA family CTQ-dependent oxidase [Nitrospinota bacterium]
MEGSFDLTKVESVKIFPALGIMRAGNHPDAYFIGPEKPYDYAPPEGGYKKDGKIKRQAARFRLYAYDKDNKLLGEILDEVAEITWEVHLANKKAAWHMFKDLEVDTPLRNAGIIGDENRKKLVIDPGVRKVTGGNKKAVFDGGNYTEWSGGSSVTGTPKTVENIYLGEMKTDILGRLTVLGGHGIAASPYNTPLDKDTFFNNDGWYDDVSDGPVNAKVKFRLTGKTHDASGAWVICTPPKYAPSIRSVISLYNTLHQTMVDRGVSPEPTQNPSFKYDIYPILASTVDVKWLQKVGKAHDFIENIDPADKKTAEIIFNSLRKPGSPAVPRELYDYKMPKLYNDEWKWGATLTPIQYRYMELWKNGQFLNDWGGVPPEPVDETTPNGLNFATLDNCDGAPMDVGIEASWYLRSNYKDLYNYIDPFRLDHSTLEAGDCSKQMSIPWHSDFYECTEYWWPMERPTTVYATDGGEALRWDRDYVSSKTEMVTDWYKLGYILKEGNAYLERERNAPEKQ